MSSNGIRSIWEKGNGIESPSSGYLIGPGDVYGGDYTIYPTHDPSNSHAMATINVLATPTVGSSSVCFLFTSSSLKITM